MRGLQRGLRLGSAMVLGLAFILTLGPVSPTTPVLATTAESCTALVKQAIDATKAACTTMGENTVCYGYDAVKATFSDTSILAQGKAIDLTHLTDLSTSGVKLADNQWGVASLNIQADVPTGSKGVQAVLFGEANLTSDVHTDPADLVTLPVTTYDSDPVILRVAPSASQPLTIRFTSDVKAVVDGRTKDSKWLRVRTADKLGWGFVSQLNVTGAIDTLAVLADTTTVPYFRYTQPMQALILNTNNAPSTDCAEIGSGLLLQYDNDKQPAHVLINGVGITLTKSTVLVRATANATLDVMVLTGTATVDTHGGEIGLNTLQMSQVRLGGATGLMAVAMPKASRPYPFAAIVGIPDTALAQPLPCMVGVTKAITEAHSGPGVKEYTSLFHLQPSTVYMVSGYATSKDGQPWWRLVQERNPETYVDQTLVQTVGACDKVEKVEPGNYMASSNGNGSGDGGASIVSGFAPTRKTIWNAVVGPDQLEGQCTSAPINYCNHMVAISPQGNGIAYKGQEIKAYFLRPVRENVYSFSGRNGIGDGKISISLTFTGPTTYTLVQVVILDADPTCKHINVVNGTFAR